MPDSSAPGPADQQETKQLRLKHPSGVLHLFHPDSIPTIIDALLDLPPNREFNKTELADHAGVTRQTITTHIDLLLEMTVIEEVPNTTPTRYRMTESPVVQELFELNSALNAAGK